MVTGMTSPGKATVELVWMQEDQQYTGNHMSRREVPWRENRAGEGDRLPGGAESLPEDVPEQWCQRVQG